MLGIIRISSWSKYGLVENNVVHNIISLIFQSGSSRSILYIPFSGKSSDKGKW
ncbi:hypothetical protein SAMN05660226_03979 [Parapedobacter luteus]|uniref:Uncharacterized protein n=1 Tax=Parapedobacter luteus TaxID=623280 RepID=A0A1T5FFN8_9SPHI|nr:hypothetical protein SAMN05660226_03979 [Parapedobacter luteus]